jgi:hypothetical protein
MKAAVLGGTGEIGSKLLTYLKEVPEVSLFATYHSRYAADCDHVKWLKCDIQSENDLRNIMSRADIIVNCAGASYLTGERVAKLAGEYGKIYVDPFGGNYLLGKVKAYEKNAEFILSSGCFPGATGFLSRVLCEKYDAIDSFAGKIIQTEVPSICGTEDFILSGLRGFGKTKQYYSGGDYKKQEIVETCSFGEESVPIQLYYTEEVDALVKAYAIEEARWYTIRMKPVVLSVMQKGVMEYLKKPTAEVLEAGAAEVRNALLQTLPANRSFPGVSIQIALQGKQEGKTKRNILILNCDAASKISAFILSEVILKVVNEGKTPGLFFAQDILPLNRIEKMKQIFDLSEEEF